MINEMDQANLSFEERALKKEKALDNSIGSFKGALVAFSGGVDSTYLLYKALQVLGSKNVLAVNLQSGLNRSVSSNQLKTLAEQLEAELLVIKHDLLHEPMVKNNSKERCYYCKRVIFGELLNTAKKRGIAAVLDGTNADDTSDYRPGMKALKELGIKSPLLDAGMTKKEIRWLSKKAGLQTWDQPSTTCLATRFPYGTSIEPEMLNRVEQAEEFLRSLPLSGDLRVRCHNNLARVEVNAEEINRVLENREKISSRLKELGFTYVTLSLDDFSSGSMNVGLFTTEE